MSWTHSCLCHAQAAQAPDQPQVPGDSAHPGPASSQPLSSPRMCPSPHASFTLDTPAEKLFKNHRLHMFNQSHHFPVGFTKPLNFKHKETVDRTISDTDSRQACLN